ncbi:hypothetical protein BD324DRAFT_247122 [Kockovaella imperatae]|uniref:Uncharacterized protein n=1 Tax=Kockovaella imperatae TaxID=4999 RepID=A0A1Y1UPM4_9TREE|nr:hypothetical protein BD324DRAFT_247122 [Kockovaella imperatae]ORX39973.1 hypothetical protein BD324DRAFT_247122 [Kockovaella imperatae]
MAGSSRQHPKSPISSARHLLSAYMNSSTSHYLHADAQLFSGGTTQSAFSEPPLQSNLTPTMSTPEPVERDLPSQISSSQHEAWSPEASRLPIQDSRKIEKKRSPEANEDLNVRDGVEKRIKIERVSKGLLEHEEGDLKSELANFTTKSSGVRSRTNGRSTMPRRPPADPQLLSTEDEAPAEHLRDLTSTHLQIRGRPPTQKEILSCLTDFFGHKLKWDELSHKNFELDEVREYYAEQHARKHDITLDNFLSNDSGAVAFRKALIREYRVSKDRLNPQGIDLRADAQERT